MNKVIKPKDKYIENIGCISCGSSDAVGVYQRPDSTFHGTCFSCNVSTTSPYGEGDTQEGLLEADGDSFGNEEGIPTTIRKPKSSEVVTPLFKVNDSSYNPLKTRGISKEVCELFNVRSILNDQGFDEVHFYPVEDHKGGTHYCVRAVLGKGFKWLSTSKPMRFFGQGRAGSNGKMIIVTEGALDALAVHQMLEVQGKSYRVISVVNGASAAPTDFKNNFEWINGFESILLAFDMDDPGQKAAKAVSEIFPLGKVKVLSYSEKDANDLLLKGKSKEFLSAVFNSRKLKVEGVVSVEDLIDEAMLPVEAGLSYPFPTLTKVMYGLRSKELIGIGAGSGSGKSQLVKEIVFHIMETHKVPVGMIMLEESASNTIKQLAGFKCNKRFHVPSEQDKSWDFEELRTALGSFKGKVYLLDHIGSKAWSSIKEKIRFMVSVLGVKFIVLDNLTALVASEDDEYKSVNLIMAEMSTLTQELDCTIFFISHLRKTQGKGAETGTEVSLADFKGSGSIIFWSNLLIALERNLQAVSLEERNTSTIRILKDRFSGEGTGTTFKLKYDKETGRMTEIDTGTFDDEGE
jgi:twinkle protein